MAATLTMDITLIAEWITVFRDSSMQACSSAPVARTYIDTHLARE